MAKKYNLQTMMLSELLRDVVDVSSLQSCMVSGLALDSRDIDDGYVFIALQGTSGHGIEFAQTAIDNGAVAILNDAAEENTVVPLAASRALVPVICVANLAEKLPILTAKFYGNATKNLRVIGITGTNGKTTCSQYIAQALNHNQATAVMGTLGNGFLHELQDTRHTTPDNITVHRLLNEFYVNGAMNVVMEVSSHGIEQGRIDNVHFDLAMFTNLTQDHLDYHGSMQEYGAAKRKLFEYYLPSIAVVNVDDDFGAELLLSLPEQIRKVSYSLADKKLADDFICAIKIVQNKQGMIISVDSSWGKAKINTPLLGRFNASNLLGTLAVLLSLDFSLSNAISQLESFVAITGRMETIETPEQALLVIDYAHTPDALLNVLQAASEHVRVAQGDLSQEKISGEIWCVFGCGGDRDKSKRSLMGRIAQQYAQHIVLTDDNPRKESAQNIVDDICKGFEADAKFSVIHDRQEAIRYAVQHAEPADIVVIAGKGHEQYQIVGSKKNTYPSDYSIAINALSLVDNESGNKSSNDSGKHGEDSI